MYLLRVESMVASGRGGDYEARWRARFVELGYQPGFLGPVQLNSLGYPAKYVNLNYWESREASRRADESEAWRSFDAANPSPGLVASRLPYEAYEPVVEVVGEGQQAAYVLLVDWTVKPGQGAAFEDNRRAFLGLLQQHAGALVAARLFRFLGSPTRYLVAASYTTLEGLAASRAIPEVAEWSRAHPVSDYISAPYVAEQYEIVQRVRA